MKVKEILVGGFVLGLLALLAFLWFSSGGLKRAPDISLNLINGDKTTFDKFQNGRPILVTFWATDCPGCRKEVPHLIELHERYASKGFDILAVAMAHDPPNRVWEFIKRKQLPYQVALDMDASAAQAFGNVRLTPTTYVVAKDGRIVFHKIGEFDVKNMTALIKRLLAEPRSA